MFGYWGCPSHKNCRGTRADSLFMFYQINFPPLINYLLDPFVNYERGQNTSLTSKKLFLAKPLKAETKTMPDLNSRSKQPLLFLSVPENICAASTIHLEPRMMLTMTLTIMIITMVTMMRMDYGNLPGPAFAQFPPPIAGLRPESAQFHLSYRINHFTCRLHASMQYWAKLEL